MLTNTTLLLIVITLSAVAAQTFQYSRGWTNGKRDGHKRNDEDNRLDKVLNPCQMHKLKFLLDGRPISEKLLIPCDYTEEESEEPRRHKMRLAQDSSYDTFQ